MLFFQRKKKKTERVADVEESETGFQIEHVERDGKTYIVFPIADDGYPISTDEIWNGCIRYIIPLRNGKPVDCVRIREFSNNKWRHPDLDIIFTWRGTQIDPTLPDGYIASNYMKKEVDIPPTELPIDLDQTHRFVRFGEKTPVLAAHAIMYRIKESDQPPHYYYRPWYLNFISGEEDPPKEYITGRDSISIGAIDVVMEEGIHAIHDITLYKDDGTVLGQPGKFDNRTYRLSFAADEQISIDVGEILSVYVIGTISAFNEDTWTGATTEKIGVSCIHFVDTDGERISDVDTYQYAFSHHFYPVFYITRGVLSITNAGAEHALLQAEKKTELATFRFAGSNEDPQTKMELLGVTFAIEGENPPTVEGVYLKTEGVEETYKCTVIKKKRIDCSDLPHAYRKLTGGQRTYTLVGNIAQDFDSSSTLQITINNAGDANNNGSVRWSDGTNTFFWLDVQNPVSKGTLFRP